MPKFSVIIPVYNVEKYLKECLDSLVTQTLEDIEFICVNDGSTDNSLEILNEYAKNDSRFVIINQHNQGQGVARNNALEVAKGEYVAFVDPDDWVEKTMFEELYAKFKETNADVIQFNFKLYFEKTGKVEYKKSFLNLKKEYNSKIESSYNWKNIQKNCLSQNIFSACIRAYALSFLRKNNIRFNEGKIGEDNLFVIMTIMLANQIYYITNRYFYNYRVRLGSSTNSLSNNNFDVFNNIKSIEKFLMSNGFLPELESAFDEYIVKALIACYRRVPPENLAEYESRCKESLTPIQYKKLKNAFKLDYGFWSRIFSIRNLYKLGLKYKVVTMLGFRFEVKQ
ncbi:glycosyltransferase [bacterium]|nr:glycosyltransferase [bacterium]